MAWQYSVHELAAILGAESSVGGGRFSGVSTDTRTIAPGQAFFALQGENFDGAAFVAQAFEKGAAVAVSTKPAPGGPCIVVPEPLSALQRFAAHHRGRYRLDLFALTGSCGKTTAKDLCGALLATRYSIIKTQGNLNNEIGCPLSLLRIEEDTRCAIIEMGANHAGEIARLCEIARPTEAAVTMVGPAHLEGFGTIENVARAKGEIVAGLASGGRFYVNADDTYCRAMAEGFAGEKVCFGTAGAAGGFPLDVALEHAAFDESGELVLDIAPIGRLRLPLPIRAHAGNVMLAVAMGLRHGIEEFEEPLRAACQGAARFRVLRVGPLEVLDDTYNANPASMAAALEALAARPGGGPRIAALGEMLELGPAAETLHAALGECAARHGVTHLFARGEHAHAMISAARAGGVPHAETLDEHPAIAAAIHAVAQPGGVLLLKGSRGMRMERVLDALKSLYSDSPPLQEGA